MDMTRVTSTHHLTFNASGNPHLPGDVNGKVMTCRWCDFQGGRWAFMQHLHDLGYCWSCHGLGVFKFRTIPDRTYDHTCRICRGSGQRTSPLPPEPKDASYDSRDFRPTE